MRPLLARLALLALTCAAASGAEVRFRKVWTEYHDADSFISYYEYHTGHEMVSNWIVLRSQPNSRGGLYFLTRVQNDGPKLDGATFVVQIISQESTNTRVFKFPAEIPHKSHLFEIGLTGTDWGGPKAQPVAWKVELIAADGSVLARTSSYLWEKPSL